MTRDKRLSLSHPPDLASCECRWGRSVLQVSVHLVSGHDQALPDGEGQELLPSSHNKVYSSRT